MRRKEEIQADLAERKQRKGGSNEDGHGGEKGHNLLPGNKETHRQR